MIYQVRHETRYSYAREVSLAAHVLHLLPRSLRGQRVLSASVAADPAAARRRDGLDHFGNAVTWLFLERPHTRFEVLSEAVVKVGFPSPPEPESTPAWERVAALAASGGPEAWEAADYLFESPMLPSAPEAGAYAAPSFGAGRPLLAALLDLNTRINRDFRFFPGATTISTPVADVLRHRKGVCQDFAHLMIAALRALGLPARYVSGYIRTRPPPGMEQRVGADQSHAWVGCWLGPSHGWIGLDPTNNLVVGDEHVIVAWGRDYGDVSPVRGIILGGGEHRVDVEVTLAPVPDAAEASSEEWTAHAR